jgi:hypothetical protein
MLNEAGCEAVFYGADVSHFKEVEMLLNTLYLASDESQWITGTAMTVDGGITLDPNLSALSAWTGEPPPSVYVGPSFKR